MKKEEFFEKWNDEKEKKSIVVVLDDMPEKMKVIVNFPLDQEVEGTVNFKFDDEEEWERPWEKSF